MGGGGGLAYASISCVVSEGSVFVGGSAVTSGGGAEGSDPASSWTGSLGECFLGSGLGSLDKAGGASGASGCSEL